MRYTISAKEIVAYNEAHLDKIEQINLHRQSLESITGLGTSVIQVKKELDKIAKIEDKKKNRLQERFTKTLEDAMLKKVFGNIPPGL